MFNAFGEKERFNGVFFCSVKQVADYLEFARKHGLQYGLGVWHKTNPPPLLEKFLNVHTSPGDLVLDPFMGSGSTGIACLNTDRRFVGIEIDDVYFQTASVRLYNNKDF